MTEKKVFQFRIKVHNNKIILLDSREGRHNALGVHEITTPKGEYDMYVSFAREI